MGKLQERENKRKSIIGGMIDAPAAPVASTGSRGRPKVDRELKKRISLSVLPIWIPLTWIMTTLLIYSQSTV